MTRKQWAGALAGGAMLLATGCDGGFFIDSNSSASTPGASSGNYLYAVNNLTDTLSEYVVGSGTLTAITGSPIALTQGLLPNAVAVSRANTYVYVGGTGAVVGYAIGGDGSLTAVSGGAISAQSVNFVALDTSPDGNWLLALDALGNSVRVYGINTTTGALSVGTALTIGAIQNAGTMTPKSLRISPNGNFVAVALGAGGVVTFTFNTSTGVLTETGTGIYSPNYLDNGVSFDTTSAYLWVSRQGGTTGTSGIATFGVNASGVPTGVGNLVQSGDAPNGILVDSTDAFVYVANRSGGTISGYNNSNGTLTPMPTSPFQAGTLATALAEDNGHKYVVAASYGGGNDLTLYNFDALTAGKLDAAATAVSGSDPAGTLALATTH